MSKWAWLLYVWFAVLSVDAIIVEFTLDDFSDSFSVDFIAAQLQTEFLVTQVAIDPLTEGTVSTESCMAGTYAQTGTGQCVACIAGKYSVELNAISESVCTQCGAGTYSSTVGANTEGTCNKCVAGTYNPLFGSDSIDDCLLCPANASSAPGSTHLQACVCYAGFHGMNGDECIGCNTTSWCVNGQLNPCPPHSTSSPFSHDVRHCLCDAGYFGDAGLGALDQSLYPLLCQFCKEDHFCPGGAVNMTYMCPDGKYSLPGSDEPADCNCPEFASSHQLSEVSAQCKCNPGYRKIYKVDSPIGGWICELCAPNEFCYSDLSFTCPPHSRSHPGSDGLLDCFCDAGFQNLTDQNTTHLCENCDANHYCNGGGHKQQCTTHAVSPTQTTDASDCYCDWGYNGLNNSECIQCESPKYCYGGIEATCVEDSSSVPLAWSLLNCSCDPGRWGPEGGPCVKCGAGKYKLIQGCLACSAVLDDDCLACDAGTFSSILGRSVVCEGCAAGLFTSTGATVCGACSTGTFSGARATGCNGCLLGQYSPTGSTACWSCGPGTYLDVPGQASSGDCKLCPAGSFTLLNGTNVSTCYSCAKGLTSESSRQLLATANIPSASGQVTATGISVSNDFSLGFTLGGLSTPNAQGYYQDIMYIASEDQVQTYAEILYDAAGLLISVGRGCQMIMPLNASDTTWSVRISISGGTMFGWVNGVHVSTSVACTVLATNTLVTTTAELTVGGLSPPNSGTVSLVTLTTTIGNSGCSGCPDNTYAESRFSVCFPCPSYSTSAAGSGMLDCICDANYERKNTSVLYAGGPVFQCGACAYGSTSMRGGTCQACSSGSYQVGLYCEECGAGTFADNGATMCSICGTGTYSARRSGSCTPCAAGKYNPDNGSMACISCDAGYYSLSGADNCTACDAGFISVTGSSVCFACAPGEYAASGAFQCSMCVAGTWSNSSIGSVLDCTWCGTGRYSTTLGANTSGVCRTCTPGTFSAEAIAPDVSSCMECGAGLFADAGSSVCGICQNGTYSLARAGQCLGCSLGTYSSSFSSTCSLCQPGAFSEVWNGTSSAVCQECENGTFSNKSGASSHLACAWCAAGEYAHAGSTGCSICQNETYSSTHAGSCLGCPEFSDALPGSALSGCICRAGFRYNRSQSVFSCDACPLGAWSTRNSEICVACPVGKASTTPRAVDASVCIACSGGQIAPMQGSSQCLSCPAGSFSGNEASTCLNCTQGSWASAVSSNCTVCVAGRYSTTILAGSDIACIGCSSGKYSTIPGATSESTCVTCPAGSRSLMGSGSTSCDSCPANTYSDSQSDACMACPVNSTSLPGADMNGCVCNGGQRTYFKSRGSGGSMSYVLDENTGQVFMQHLFAISGQWMLDMFLSTVVLINCDGVPDPSDNIVWTKGLRDIRGVFSSCTQNITVTYQVDGPFSLNVSSTYFKCETCNSGFYSNKGAESCMACPVGKFQDTPGSAGIASCKSCGPGRITPSQGASYCVTCEQGTYQATLTACLQCPPGGYALTGKTICSICPRDYWSDAGSYQCQQCPPYSNSSNGSALSGCLCLPGYHHVGLINSSGEVDAGNFTCEACRAGYYSGSNFSACLPCGTGFYSDALAGVCLPCSSGKYQPNLVGPNVSACLACPSGSNADPASAACISCPPSYYCTGAGLQEPCPLGTYSPNPGLQNASACPICPADSFCVDTLTLEYCPANTHSEPGTTSKLQCLCDPGYTCTYKKAIKAVVTLPLTEAQFELVRDEFLQAVADAAGVTVDKVAIINIRPRPVAARRRLLSLSGGRKHTTGDVAVHLHIKEAHTIETLDRHLIKRGMPKSSGFKVHHKHRLFVVRTRVLQYI